MAVCLICGMKLANGAARLNASQSMIVALIVGRHARPRAAFVAIIVLVLNGVEFFVVVEPVGAGRLVAGPVGAVIGMGQLVKQPDIARRLGAGAGDREIGRVVADRR